jgi:DNA-binding transcriptional ArsR family regulator
LTCRKIPTYIPVVQANALFSALANPVRRRILEILREGPRSAGDIASEFDVNRPAVSEHVQVLRNLGLVTEEARGRRRFYRLNAAPLSEASDWLRPFEHYWGQRMRALRKTLDEEKHP